jgi:hypothetical protein
VKATLCSDAFISGIAAMPRLGIAKKEVVNRDDTHSAFGLASVCLPANLKSRLFSGI